MIHPYTNHAERRVTMMTRILIADDNSTNLYMLESLLKGDGFEVTSAENGQVALDKARLNPPDMIVSDILMPVMDGYTLCRLWRADDALKQIPFIFYTATYTEQKDESFALSLGADRFILKPQEPEIFLNVVKEVLKERRSLTKPLGEEMEFFRQHNEILFKKLEKKMLDLELANHELMILEERYRLSFENATDVISMIDENLHVSSMSPSVERILGYTPQDFIGRPVCDLGNIFSPDSFEQVMAEMSLVLKGKTIPATIYRFIAKDGTIRHGEVSISPILRDGRIIGMISVARDITDRIRSEEALKNSEDMLRTVFKAVPHAVTVLDSDRLIRNANDAAFDIFGYPREELIGRNSRFLYFSDEEYRKTGEALYGNSKAMRTSVIEVRMRRKDGAEIWVLLSATPLHTQDASAGAVVAALDITARKNLEIQLRQSQKMEAIGQLAGGVAHDFNNMLQAILGYTDMVLFTLGPDDPNRGKLMEVYKAGQRASTLTHQLLAFSRRQVLKLVPLDLNQVVEDLMKMVRRLIGENIDLVVIPGRGLWTVSADRGQIEQVLLNLCVNARDAMTDGGRLSIETENILFDTQYCAQHEWAKPGRYVQLSVTDNGFGMDKTTLDKIFEPFFTTKEPDKGTGLGLATVYGIVRQHEGMIQVYSEPGKGSRFSLYLSAIAQTVTMILPDAEEPVPGGHETILLAEDNKAIRLLATNILEASGYKVLTADDGEDALRLYRKHGSEIDLLVLDVLMPKKSGRSVYDEIRSIRPDVRCLFVSGYSANAVHTNFIVEQNLRLIQKPFKNVDLLRAVREVLDQS
jgi:two-component system, cell cycle sensor histidine kinase and response regulator CckA